MTLHLAALTLGKIFQLARDGTEGFTNRNIHILVLGAISHEFRARHHKIDVYTVEFALVLMSLRCFHHHATTDNPIIKSSELFRFRPDT